MPALVRLDSTYGSMLIGSMISMWLFGASVAQLYVYFFSFPEDVSFIRTIVSVVMAVDVVQAAFMTHLMYEVLVTNWGDVSSLGIVPWSLHAETIANAIVVFMVQCFFIRRIWVLSGYKHWLAGIFSALALMTLGGGMYFGINDAGHSAYSKFHENTPILVIWGTLDVILDGSITGFLCYYLHESRSGIKNSDNILDTLIIFTINTGLLTFTAASLRLIFFVATPTTSVHFAFHSVLAKLYTNSLYGSLNTRMAFRGDLSARVTTFRGTGQSAVNSMAGAKQGTSVPQSYVPRTVDIAYVNESEGSFSPTTAARDMGKLEVGTDANDHTYESHAV